MSIVSGIVSKPTECEHEYEIIIDQKPTCGKAGSQHQECIICGQKGAFTVIPATGDHKYGDWKIVTQATTTKAGSKQRTCSVCGMNETAVIAKSVAASSSSTSLKTVEV